MLRKEILPTRNYCPREPSRISHRVVKPASTTPAIKKVAKKTVKSTETGWNRLPDDAIREIIKHSEDSLRNLRLVDRRCNTLIVEHLGRNIPRIGCVSIHCSKQNTDISLTIPKTKSLYFRHALRDFKPDLFCIKFRSDSFYLCKTHFHHNPGHVKQLRAMNGLSIGTVSVSGVGNPATAEKVKELLSLWKFEEVDLRCNLLTDWKSDFLFSIICMHNVTSVRIDVTKCTVRDPRSVLLQLAEKVEELSITQWPNFDVKFRTNYLFGLVNHDWVELIGEIFTRKISYLRLENKEHFHIQREDEVRQLLKIVAVSDADNVFSSTIPCGITMNVPDQRNGYGLKEYFLGQSRRDLCIRRPKAK